MPGVGATSLPAASAQSVCSSLSSVACPGSAATCGNFGTAVGTSTGVVIVVGGAGRIKGPGWVGGLVSVIGAIFGWGL